MSFIYILSDEYSSIEKYKVGYHSGTLDELITRYITAIPRLNIHYFIYFYNAPDIENSFKNLYRHKRVLNINNTASEWVSMCLEDISNYFLKLINEYKTIRYRGANVLLPEYMEETFIYKNKIINNNIEKEFIIEESKIIQRFKNNPSQESLTFLGKHYEIINNAHDHLMKNINYIFKTNLGLVIPIFHTESDIYKKYAIEKWCELLRTLNLFTDTGIPDYCQDLFDPDIILRKSDEYHLVYFDTRYLARTSGEPERQGFQISDKVLELANFTAGAFGLDVKSIKTIQAVIKILERSIHLWLESDIITGRRFEKQIDNNRIKFTPYLICAKKKYVEIAKQLKTYEDLEKDYSIGIVNIDTNKEQKNISSIIQENTKIYLQDFEGQIKSTIKFYPDYINNQISKMSNNSIISNLAIYIAKTLNSDDIYASLLSHGYIKTFENLRLQINQEVYNYINYYKII